MLCKKHILYVNHVVWHSFDYVKYSEETTRHMFFTNKNNLWCSEYGSEINYYISKDSGYERSVLHYKCVNYDKYLQT